MPMRQDACLPPSNLISHSKECCFASYDWALAELHPKYSPCPFPTQSSLTIARNSSSSLACLCPGWSPSWADPRGPLGSRILCQVGHSWSPSRQVSDWLSLIPAPVSMTLSASLPLPLSHPHIYYKAVASQAPCSTHPSLTWTTV